MHYIKGCKALCAICVALVILITLFCGCKGNDSISPMDLTDHIYSKYNFSSLNSLSGSDLSSHFQFQDSDVKRFSVLISASADSADTIAAFEVTDEKQHALVVSGISGYITKLSTSFKNTITTEYTKIQNRIFVEIDNVILLVICSEPDEIEKMLLSLSAEPIY